LALNRPEVSISNTAIFLFPIVLQEILQLYKTIEAQADPHTPFQEDENLYKIDKWSL